MHGRHDPQGREIVLALARVLRHPGITFGVLRKEKCTGDPARRLGNDLAVSQVAEANAETLRAAKVGQDGIDLSALRSHHWRGTGANLAARFEIEHHSELLARLAGSSARAVRQPRERWSFTTRATWAAIAESTMSRAQSSRIRRGARAAADARAFVLLRRGWRPDVSRRGKGKRVNVARVEELVATGAQTIGTACPFCQTMFRDALGVVTQTSAEAARYRADCGG